MMIRRTGASSRARGGLAFAVSLAFVGPAFADDAKDGEALANQLCARCHVVSHEVGPAFAEIAKGPHASRDSLRDFLRATHADVSHPGAMPAPELSEHQIDALAAYIAGLRAAP